MLDVHLCFILLNRDNAEYGCYTHCCRLSMINHLVSKLDFNVSLQCHHFNDWNRTSIGQSMYGLQILIILFSEKQKFEMGKMAILLDKKCPLSVNIFFQI